MSGLFTSLTSAQTQSPIKEDTKQVHYIVEHLLHILQNRKSLRSDICILSVDKSKVVRAVDLMGKKVKNKAGLRYF
jgi:hypothetical protein